MLALIEESVEVTLMVPTEAREQLHNWSARSSEWVDGCHAPLRLGIVLYVHYIQLAAPNVIYLAYFVFSSRSICDRVQTIELTVCDKPYWGGGFSLPIRSFYPLILKNINIYSVLYVNCLYKNNKNKHKIGL